MNCSLNLQPYAAIKLTFAKSGTVRSFLLFQESVRVPLFDISQSQYIHNLQDNIFAASASS